MPKRTSDETWEKIRAEYITQGKKPVELAKKYKVSKNTVYARADREKWEEKRGLHREEVGKKALETLRDNQIADVVRMVGISDQVLSRLEEMLEHGQMKHMTPSGMKNITEALLNIKVLRDIRTPEDIEEQKARIAKLRRDSERNETAGITVVLGGGVDEYGG